MVKKKQSSPTVSASEGFEKSGVGSNVLAAENIHLRALCDIITDAPLDFDRQVFDVLQQGLAMLNMDLGIVSKIEADRYSVIHFIPSSAPLEVGQMFTLGNTYCALTIEEQDVVAIEHMAKSSYVGHPCYESFGLESYIGVPVFVEGKPYGTLNFSSTSIRKQVFTEADKNFVRLTGRWLGSRISSNIQSEKLSLHQQELERLVEERTVKLSRSNEQLHKEIVENKRAQKTLQEQQSLLSTLLETIPLPVYYKDIDGRYLGCNRSFGEYLQASKKDIVGKTIYDFTTKEMADAFNKKDRELFDNPGTQRFEWNIKGRDGKIRDLIYQKATIIDEQGDVAGLIGSIVDISERNQLDKRLQQAQKMESIGNLAGGIAHDFNNILNPILGFSELLLEDLVPGSREQKDVQQIFNAGKRATDLVRQILTFSRNSEQDKTPVLVQEILGEVMLLCRSTIPANIELHEHIDDHCGLVMASSIQVHQVAMNLITNAYHALEDENGEISVSLKEISVKKDEPLARLVATGVYAYLSVSDTGRGISSEVKTQIFDPYFTTKEKGKGTGLGLSTVHGIVQDHKGVIQVNSEPGQGATFNVYLPLMAKKDHTDLVFQAKNPKTGTEQILIVDDEEIIVKVQRRVLESLGYTVMSYTSSVMALERFRKTPSAFDLVITDMAMPHMTGDLLARELLVIRPDIPIIICTGYSEKLNRENVELLGIKSLLKKPVNKFQLAEEIRKVLDEN